MPKNWKSTEMLQGGLCGILYREFICCQMSVRTSLSDQANFKRAIYSVVSQRAGCWHGRQRTAPAGWIGESLADTW